MWGDFTSTHDVQPGPQWAESEIAESPVYPTPSARSSTD